VLHCDILGNYAPLNILGLIFILFEDFALFVGVLRWYKVLAILLDAVRKVKGTIVVVVKGPLFHSPNL